MLKKFSLLAVLLLTVVMVGCTPAADTETETPSDDAMMNEEGTMGDDTMMEEEDAMDDEDSMEDDTMMDEESTDDAMLDADINGDATVN